MNWVIIDVETDGFRPPIHILEIAAQRMRGFQKDAPPFHIFLNHDVPIHPTISSLHGLTQERLRKEGVDPVFAHEMFRDYVGDDPLCAHYIAYDWDQCLVPEWERLNISPFGKRGWCSCELAKQYIPELQSHKLPLLREHFGLAERPNDHHAQSDVETVVALFQKVLVPRGWAP